MRVFGGQTGRRVLSAGRGRRAWLLGASLTLALVLAGCASTNTYPIDFFSEMHYQKSWGAGEPDGWNPPAGAVPITGGEVAYTMEEAAELENPFAGDAAAEALGAQLFAINCSQCHGIDGQANTFIAATFQGYGANPPANLVEMPRGLNDGEIFFVVTHGFPEGMPAFQRLLTEEQRWAVVAHLRTLGE
jgi:mono/diheme cytochrome c family protein